MTGLRPNRPLFQRLGAVMACVLLLKAAALAVGLAAPARAAAGGDKADLFAALSVICTPGGVKMLSSDGKTQAPAAADCPLCAAAAHCALAAQAAVLSLPAAAAQPQALAVPPAAQRPAILSRHPRAPPASIPA